MVQRPHHGNPEEDAGKQLDNFADVEVAH
jgi:hypothetical protein